MSQVKRGSGQDSRDGAVPARRLRSRSWFDDPAHADMTALYIERYTNFGLSVEELQSNRPIIGIAQTGSDLSPCNRHHLVLAQRRQALQDAGGYPFPASQTPWQELQRANVGQLQTGAVLEPAVKYQRLAQTQGVPRHSH